MTTQRASFLKKTELLSVNVLRVLNRVDAAKLLPLSLESKSVMSTIEDKMVSAGVILVSVVDRGTSGKEDFAELKRVNDVTIDSMGKIKDIEYSLKRDG